MGLAVGVIVAVGMGVAVDVGVSVAVGIAGVALAVGVAVGAGFEPQAAAPKSEVKTSNPEKMQTACVLARFM